jgi:exopolyphosphatase/guanosine-5'-triphosphate,3'-diphosphate pyrophosphatase
VANLSKTLLRAVSSARRSGQSKPVEAPGRLPASRPVAVFDIGSNSVRLVVYERLSRNLTPLFNEKALCGLGREVATKGRLAPDAVEKALAALSRFRALCDVMQVAEALAIATAAVRDASDGPEFIERAKKICRCDIEVLSGNREAKLAAFGVISGSTEIDGVIGDLGGGSLELVDVKGEKIGDGITMPLGSLSLADASSRSIKQAEKIVRDKLEDEKLLKDLKGRTFYAVGGTWRAIARLHMMQKGYPLHVMHGYSIPAKEAMEFSSLIHRVDPETLSRIEVISEARRPLLAYGSLVLEQIVKAGKPSSIIVSALGVREGLLFERLSDEDRAQDPLIEAAREYNYLRSRSPEHGEELIAWTDRFMESTGIDETPEEMRLRHAGCLLADIGWRAHPDYRGEQSLNIISNAAFSGIDHPGRAFLALAVFYRYAGLNDEDLSPRIREIASTRLLDRARILGAVMRVAYVASASMPGVLPRSPLVVEKGVLKLKLSGELAALASGRLYNRVRQLGKLIGREYRIETA